MNKLPLSALALAVLAQIGCGAAVPPGDEAQPEERDVHAQDIIVIPIRPPCTSVTANETLYIGTGYNIPFTALPHSSESGDASYYYEGCGRWVVDLYVGDTRASPYNYELGATGSAHDLPSSSQLGGVLPNNAIDCAAYRLYLSFYRKNASNTWDTLGSSSQQGVWSSATNKCNLQVYSGSMTSLSGVQNTDGSGWDIYRVAVGVKLRSSGQEAKVVVDGGIIIPPPK
ncbi:hypothetical protein [Pyxidicoccus sp. MSG2]|uniref:hypothetical protein n=1 Tax=Pyxidicoccus sp. MSG2 TaxID=2996790 RepID=UPI00226D6C40|nr:hypothetical protein [Pyxidicoccus sp. MSG2]MCY1018244.1 hypothetical protein [Pyxidicoccus sp. MSG2]